MVWRVVVGWLLRFIVAPVAIILLSLLALTFCVAVLRADAAETCEKVNIKGEAQFVAGFINSEGEWVFAEPGPKVAEGKVVVMPDGSRPGFILFMDSESRVFAYGYNWHEHGDQKRFCLR